MSSISHSPMSRRMFGLSLSCATVLATPVLAAGPRVLRDLKYGPAPRQALDLYLPAQPDKTPIMVMVHGGAWAVGDKSHRGVWANKQHHWGAKGYLFASVNYRMIPEADPLEQARDVARAIAWVQANATRHGADPARMVVMGHSAGAHLVSLLAADPDLAGEQGARPWRATVALDTTAYDVEALMSDNPARLFRKAFGTDPALWRATSPIARLKRGTRPFLLVCSSTRRTSCAAARGFAEAVRARAGAAQVLSVALPHNQINKELGKPGSYTASVDRFLKNQGLP